jgi:hypothetical protein
LGVRERSGQQRPPVPFHGVGAGHTGDASASPATWLKVAVRRSSVVTRANRSLPSSCGGSPLNHEPSLNTSCPGARSPNRGA